MKAYLIPGNGEDLHSSNYQAVLDIYKDKGYEPHFVPVIWKYKTIDDWVEQVRQQIPASDLADSLLSGFSFGSMIALAIAAKVNPKRLLLFSLSPYFAEDIPDMPEKYKQWAGKRQIAKFEQLSFNKLASQIKCPTSIFIGSKEIEKYTDTKKRIHEANEQIADSKLIVVKDVGHDVGDPKYIEAIKKEFSI